MRALGKHLDACKLPSMQAKKFVVLCYAKKVVLKKGFVSGFYKKMLIKDHYSSATCNYYTNIHCKEEVRVMFYI